LTTPIAQSQPQWCWQQGKGAVAMKSKCKAILVRIFRGLRTWGPLVALALIVPGGWLLALAFLRHRQHTHGAVR
jgi:hypothetical protein